MTGPAAEHLSTLPWPFPDDLTAFRYSANVEPGRTPHQTAAGVWGAGLSGPVRVITVGQSYVAEGQKVRVAAAR